VTAAEPAPPFRLARGERSFTEPVANIAVLPAEAFRHDLVGMLGRGVLAPRFVPSFIHEVTHHRCFWSPVGNAVAWVNMRARRRALHAAAHGAGGDDDEALDVFDDFIRCETTLEALRPLTEGLALFAEHDVVPGSSPSLSEVMQLVVRHCMPIRSEAMMTTELPAYLRAMRRRHTAFQRKLHLLLQPLDTDGDGYLPGYLTVKNLWRATVAQEPRLLDTDLFLQYVTASVFHDLGLVAHILDDRTSDVGAAKRIADYVGWRLGRLLADDVGAQLDALERARTTELVRFTASDLDAISRPNLDTDPQLWELGEERLRTAAAQLAAEAAGTGPGAELAREHMWALAQRELIVLARTPTRAWVADEGEVVFAFSGYGYRTGTTSDEPPGSELDDATLTLALNPSPWGQYTAMTLSAASRAVRTWFNPSVDDALRSHFAHYDLDSDRRLEEDAVLAATLEQVMAADETDRILFEHTRESMSSWRRQLYGLRALAYVPEAEVVPLLCALEDGFASLLGGVAPVRALAWISLNAPDGTRDELAERFAAEQDLHRCSGDLLPWIARINERAAAKLHEPLVVEHRGRLYAHV
jgi:hypothetical protein